MKRHCLLLLAASVAWLTGCTDPASKLPRYNHIPAFQLTASNGSTFDSNALRGKVWIVDFIYTNCPGPCPRMTSKMHRLEERFRSDPGVRFVSISVDPGNDTPPVLDAFAHKFGGPQPDWVFLTGKPETIHNLVRNVFSLGDLISVMDHSTKFAVVGKSGDIRGYYSSFEEEDIAKLISDTEALQKERL